jgi:hypothetical protein
MKLLFSDTWQVVRSFLCFPPEFEEDCMNFSSLWTVSTFSNSDWRNFLNSSKAWRELKRKTVYFGFSESNSSRFLFDSGFRSQVLSIIESPARQIGLSLYSHNLESTGIETDAHYLLIEHQEYLPYISHLDTLVLIGENEFTLTYSFLSSLKKLNLRDAFDLNFQPGILSQLQHLALFSCTSTTGLQYLTTLSSFECDDSVPLEEIMLLHHNIKSLSLSWRQESMEEIVSVLQNFQNALIQLKLDNCSTVNDLSFLKNFTFLKTLILNSIPQPVGFVAFQNIQSLKMDNLFFWGTAASAIANPFFATCWIQLNSFQNLKEVKITSDETIKELQLQSITGSVAIPSLRKLYLGECYQVRKICCSYSLISLEISFCLSLSEIIIQSPSLPSAEEEVVIQSLSLHFPLTTIEPSIVYETPGKGRILFLNKRSV